MYPWGAYRGTPQKGVPLVKIFCLRLAKKPGVHIVPLPNTSNEIEEGGVHTSLSIGMYP